MGLDIINTDAEHHTVGSLNFAQLIPERAQLRCSAAGEILGIKRQNDVLFTEKIAQVTFSAGVIL